MKRNILNSDQVFWVLDGTPEFENLGMDQKAELFLSITNSVNAGTISGAEQSPVERAKNLATEYIRKLGL